MFERFRHSNADLLATLLGPIKGLAVQDMPPEFRDETGKRPEPSEAIAGFFPIYRMSKQMISIIDKCYRQGWNGHFEYSLGTMARRFGLAIEDIGGDGPFVKSHNVNTFYYSNRGRWDKSPGTFVFRPSFSSVQRRNNTLWHPVKPEGNYFNHSPPSDRRDLVGWAKSIAKAGYYWIAITLWFKSKWRRAD